MGALMAGFYEQALETAPDGFIVVDAEGVIHFVNRQAEALFGYRREELIGMPIDLLVPERVRERHPDHRSRYFSSPATRPMAANLELSARRSDGSEFPVDISLSPLQTEEGMWVSAAIRDATARKAAEVELRSAYDRLSATVEEMERQRIELAVVSEMGDMLQSCLRTEEAYAIITAAAVKLFGHTDGVVYRPTGSLVELESVSMWGDRDYQKLIVAEDCWALRRGRLHRRTEDVAAYACPHSAGQHTPWSLCLPLLAHGELLGLLHVQPSDDDATSRTPERLQSVERLAVTVAEHLSLALANLKLRENLRVQSERDALTGLFNRRHMDVVLQHEVGRAIREGDPLSMLLIDVDDFKQVNDTRSHVDGDNCLRTVSRILLSLTRGTDVACRYGGDEFAVILPRVTEPAALDRAERIRSQVESETGITVSIGVAGLHDDSELASEILFSLCDSLLRQAKANGKNRVIGPLTSPMRRSEEWASDRPGSGSGQLIRLGPD